ncbi:hypothetical protein HQ560_14585, partial [bacterium]|nr:hypothetical protein [bacterium]
TTGDIDDAWETIEKYGFSQDGLECYAGPNRWNDPDMLVVGMYGNGNSDSHTGCTDTEYRTHFSLWCMLASPLMIGCDVRTLSPEAREILTNPEVVAVNQDAFGRQGACVGKSFAAGDVWAKPLGDGSIAVGLFNRKDAGDRLMSFAWESVGLHDRRPAAVRDLWAREDLGIFTGSFSTTVEPHGCTLLRLTPIA